MRRYSEAVVSILCGDLFANVSFLVWLLGMSSLVLGICAAPRFSMKRWTSETCRGTDVVAQSVASLVSEQKEKKKKRERGKKKKKKERKKERKRRLFSVCDEQWLLILRCVLFLVVFCCS